MYNSLCGHRHSAVGEKGKGLIFISLSTVLSMKVIVSDEFIMKY